MFLFFFVRNKWFGCSFRGWYKTTRIVVILKLNVNYIVIYIIFNFQDCLSICIFIIIILLCIDTGHYLYDTNNIMIYNKGGSDSKQQIRLLSVRMWYSFLLCKDYFILICIRLCKVYLKHLGIFKCIKVIINALITIVDILSICIATNAFVLTSGVDALRLTLEYFIFILILCLTMSIVLKCIYVFELILLVFFDMLMVNGTMLIYDIFFIYNVINVFGLPRNTFLNYCLTLFYFMVFVFIIITIVAAFATYTNTLDNSGGAKRIKKESKETQKERYKQPRKKSKRSWRYGIETIIKIINVAQ